MGQVVFQKSTRTLGVWHWFKTCGFHSLLLAIVGRLCIARQVFSVAIEEEEWCQGTSRAGSFSLPTGIWE